MRHRFTGILLVVCCVGLLSIVGGDRLRSEPPGPPKPEAATDEPKEAPPLDPPVGLLRLDAKTPLWVDRDKKQVLVDGKICLRQGPLEVFACPKGTKEHEAILSIDAKPSVIHAALLAVGAKPGKPAKFQPKFVPASGQEIELFVVWKDDKGAEHKVRGQELIQDVPHKKDPKDKDGPKKEMSQSWVFAGSGFWKDDMTGHQYYMADSGEFVCLSNFPGAMIDVPFESSESNDNLEFAAFTEHIPPVGTRVRLILVPKEEKKN